MLYLVQYYDSEVQEWAEMEFGNERHANETYDMYNGIEGVTRLEIHRYDMESKKYNKVR